MIAAAIWLFNKSNNTAKSRLTAIRGTYNKLVYIRAVTFYKFYI
jgi:hypothetical protein